MVYVTCSPLQTVNTVDRSTSVICHVIGLHDPAYLPSRGCEGGLRARSALPRGSSMGDGNESPLLRVFAFSRLYFDPAMSDDEGRHHAFSSIKAPRSRNKSRSLRSFYVLVRHRVPPNHAVWRSSELSHLATLILLLQGFPENPLPQGEFLSYDPHSSLYVTPNSQTRSRSAWS